MTRVSATIAISFLLFGCAEFQESRIKANPSINSHLVTFDFDERRIAMFGHKVKLEDRAIGENKLILNGREVHENWGLTLESVTVVDGTGVLIGRSYNGGNICQASPFVVSLPPGQSARFDGPLGSCGSVTYSVHQNDIRFEERARPAVKGTVWKWTLTNGLKEVAQISFEPDKTRGWTALRERTAEHPANLLQFDEIASQIYTLLGKDKNDVLLSLIDGTGSGSFVGDVFVGWTCFPIICSDGQFVIAADIRSKKVFLAWSLWETPHVVFRPPAAEWPWEANATLNMMWSRDRQLGTPDAK